MKKLNYQNKYTAQGLTTVFIWGTSVAFVRTLSESLGIFTAGAITGVLAGILSLAAQAKKKNLSDLKHAPSRYWMVCLPLYILFKLSTDLSVGIARTREQVVTSGLIRLMWPLMTLIFVVILFKKENKASRWFPVSIIVSACGIIVANGDVSGLSVLSMIKNLSASFWPCLLALISASAWGLYSNYNRLIIGKDKYDGVGLFMLLSGLISFAITFFVDEPQKLSMVQVWELAYQVIISIYIGTKFWNAGMQKGNQILIIFFANFLPVFTTVFSGLMLGVKLTAPVIIGSIMVVIGTIWSKMCIKSNAAPVENKGSVKYDAVLFDFDGTIANTAEDVWLAIDYALAKQGLNLNQEYWGDTRNLAFPLDKILSDNFGDLPENVVIQIGCDVRTYYGSMSVYPSTYMYPGIKEILERLKNEKVKTGIISSKGENSLKRILRLKGWDQYFDFCIGADSIDGLTSKQEQIAFLLSNSIKTKNAVYIGDSYSDIIAARNNNMDAVGVLYGDGDNNLIVAEHPTYICTTAEEAYHFLFNYAHLNNEKSIDDVQKSN